MPQAPTTSAAPAAAGLGNPAPSTERRPIDPDLPPDHPLEPGASRWGNTPAERIAASEAALGASSGANLGVNVDATREAAASDPDAKANFIAAARRAAQAASTQLAGRNDRRLPEPPRRLRGEQPTNDVPAGGHARMLLVAASVVMIVLGSLQVLSGLFHRSGGAPVAPDEPTASAPSGAAPVEMDPTLATPPGRQSGLLPVETAIAAPSAGVLAPPEPFAPPAVPASPDTATTLERLITGSVSQPSLPPVPPPPPARPQATTQPVDAGRLPASMGQGLRLAATKGDPAAAFEVAVRYAEGRGTPQNFAAAAEWFDRAAKQGLAPAQFRLGGLYEKGMGVKKDLDAARRLYIAAAQAGNAKAMHNLAVLYAEGADGKPDYQTAAIWFRKAADHGVTDSQYNLGILYARGIGVETNLAEAYKWFALAARDGDRDSAKKRDELGTRLDQATAAAAHSAVRNWTAEPQPDAAIHVRVPSGGWDGTPTTAGTKRRVSSDAKSQRVTP